MQTIVLVPNPQRDHGFEVTLKTAKLLQEENFTCITTEKSAVPGLPALPTKEAFAGAFAAICFGGDGTLIHCAKTAALYDVPVMGVNMGHTGFLTYLSPDSLDKLRMLKRGQYSIQERMALEATVRKDGQVLSNQISVNDIVISRGMVVQTISLEVKTETHSLGSFLGDGVIISAATGSTGYALSSGGPVIDPDLDAMLVTPICAHTTYAHPFVLSPEHVLNIHATHAAHRDTYLSIDGETPVRIEPGQIVEVSRSRVIVRMLMLDGNSFFDQVRTKIHQV